MVNNNKLPVEQSSGQVQEIYQTASFSSSERKPRSIWKIIGIVLLVIVGIIIAIPFLLFIACLGIVNGF